MLKSFGIPVESFPLDADGRGFLEYHFKYLEERKNIEMERKQEEMSKFDRNKIVAPSRKDILLGRGRPYQGEY